MSRGKQREVVRTLLRQRHYQEWRQHEDLGVASTSQTVEAVGAGLESTAPWRVRAKAALDCLSEKIENIEPMDISVDDVRVPTETEIVETMIAKRLKAEDELVQREELANKRQKLSTDVDQPSQEAMLVVEGAADNDLDQIAPILTIEEVRRERGLKARTRSARLVLEAQQQGPRPAYLLAAQQKPSPAFRSSIEGDPHEKWIDRIAARCTGDALRAMRWSCKSRMSDCKPGDITGIPDDIPRIDPNEVIVTVAVCNTQGAKEQEFDMLASQSLAELRDAFWFVQDWMFDGPRRIKSACFVIDGIFYVDRRHQSACDYSRELIEWMRETRHGFLRANTPRSMDLRLCDIDRVPFGERCIYLHQGDIEHNVFFTGARLVGPGDCPFVEAYPLLIFMRVYFKRRCYGCLARSAIWMVLDSVRTPHNPCFLCVGCFRHFYQDEAGEMRPPVDYKVFPYLHDE